jgi:dTDP-glucose pyrophosphorylase
MDSTTGIAILVRQNDHKSMMSLTLLVLAGGIGSRFGGEKQKTGLGPYNRSLPEYGILDARQSGFEKVVLVIREGQKQAWINFLNERHVNENDIILAEQSLPAPELKRIKPWGTAHALLSGARNIEGNFMVVNGDDYYGKQAYKIMANELSRKPPGSGLLLPYLLGKTLSPYGAVSRAICKVDEKGNLSGVNEVHGLQEPLHIDTNTAVSMNCWGFDSGIVPELENRFNNFLAKPPTGAEEFGIPQTIESLIHETHYAVKVLQAAEGWFGITYPQDVAAANEMLAKIEEPHK